MKQEFINNNINQINSDPLIQGYFLGYCLSG